MKNLLKLIWKQKLMIPRVQTFAWRLLWKALPTGLRVGRFSVHISQYCCRCGQQEDEFHLFFLCHFARAAWFSSPWFLKADVLLQGHSTMHSVLTSLIQMRHPHGSIPNILNFRWCLWKAHNDFLFNRKKALPYQGNIASVALNLDSDDVLSSLSNKQQQIQHHLVNNQLPLQGTMLKSDLLIVGANFFLMQLSEQRKSLVFHQVKLPQVLEFTSQFHLLKEKSMFRFRPRQHLLPLLRKLKPLLFLLLLI